MALLQFMFKCTLGHKRGNLDSRTQTRLVITHKKGLIPNFFFFFFFFSQTHTPPQLHPREWNQNQASPDKHEVTDPKRALLQTACLCRGEHEKLQITNQTPRAAAWPCVTSPKDATSGCISEMMLLHPPQFTRRHLQASFALPHQENALLHRGIP